MLDCVVANAGQLEFSLYICSYSNKIRLIKDKESRNIICAVCRVKLDNTYQLAAIQIRQRHTTCLEAIALTCNHRVQVLRVHSE